MKTLVLFALLCISALAQTSNTPAPAAPPAPTLVPAVAAPTPPAPAALSTPTISLKTQAAITFTQLKLATLRKNYETNAAALKSTFDGDMQKAEAEAQVPLDQGATECNAGKAKAEWKYAPALGDKDVTCTLPQSAPRRTPNPGGEQATK